MDLAQNHSDNIIRGPDLEYTPDSRGLGYVLYESMMKNSEKVAQIHGVNGEKDTYSSLLLRCTKTAHKLSSLGPTSFSSVPIQHMILCQNKPKHVDTSSLVNVGVGGGALIASQISDIKNTFPNAQIFPVYGQTEMCFAITLFNVGSKNHLEFIDSKPTSSGTVVPGIWNRLRAGVRIVDHIPLAGTGKAKRREIADMVLRGEM
ncbi:hypothetical protein FQR65_LT01343 [Abscondita terminalis]|nr:hypothetical protein FQR65_LT01343 [Abscondita terminalis]